MSSLLKLGPLVLAALACSAAVFACATQGNEADPRHTPDAASDSNDVAPLDAGPDVDAATEPPRCADSGLCTVRVSGVDTRINITSVSGSGASDVWAVGTDRTILHYDGATWEKAKTIEYDAAAFTMRSVWVSGPTDVWLTDGPLLRHTTGWNGPNATEWTSSTLDGANAMPSGISGKGGRVVISRQLDGAYDSTSTLVICNGWDAAGVREPDYHFPQDGTRGLWSTAMTRPDEAWSLNVGTQQSPGARVVRAYLAEPDGGAEASWTLEEHDGRTPKNLYGVWGDEAVIWVVGEGGTLRRMTREKVPTRVFEVVPSPVITDLRGVYGFGADDVWAVGDDATVLHWDGKSLTKVATPFDAVSAKPRLFAVWGSAANDVWIGGNGVMLHLEGKTP